MDRELKFRAWTGEHMGYFELFGGTSLAGFPIMQFTGLLDKHGKEIYEGDICKTGSEHTPHVYVDWHDGDASYWLRNCHIQGWLINGSLGECVQDIFWRLEVIGNIYENADLLNK